MTKGRKRVTRNDRVAQYIDSPMMTQRVRHGRQLSARIEGTYGTYHTRTTVGRRPDRSCSCPSENRPCKHVVALEATWRANPESFFDLATVMDVLATKSKADLVALVGQMALLAPESLSACGITAFDRDETEMFD
jgi:uncharacterized Zn finger protein